MDWGKILGRYAEGANPEAFARARAQKEEMVNNEQRRNLLAAQEGRASQEFEHERSNWSTKDQLLAKQLEAAGLSVEQARQAVEESKFKAGLREAGGGVEGEFGRQEEERKMKIAEQKARIAQAQNAIKMSTNANEREKAIFELQKAKMELENEIAKETKPATVEAAFDRVNPRDSYLGGVGSIANLLRNAGEIPEEQRQGWLSEAERLMAAQRAADEERAARKRATEAKIPGAVQTPPARQQVAPQAGESSYFGLGDTATGLAQQAITEGAKWKDIIEGTFF